MVQTFDDVVEQASRDEGMLWTPPNERFVVLSDIHANMDALHAVLQDVRKRGLGPEDVVNLGDLVGYGPDPVRVIRASLGFPVNIRGNHDVANHINDYPVVSTAILASWLWTQGKIKGWEGYLSKMPFVARANVGDYRFKFQHASPNPEGSNRFKQYIMPNYGEAHTHVPSRDVIMPHVDHVDFVGHSHHGMRLTETGRERLRPNVWYSLPQPGEKGVLNPGSVGQPRDSDPRAGYILVDGDKFMNVRVKYNVETTIQRMLRFGVADINGNDIHTRYLANRLRTGT